MEILDFDDSLDNIENIKHHSIEEMIEDINQDNSLEEKNIQDENIEIEDIIEYDDAEIENINLEENSEPVNLTETKDTNSDNNLNPQIDLIETHSTEEKQPIEENNELNVIEKYGENLSGRSFVTNPAIGRDSEIDQLIVILLTPEKSGILVGKPGIGKTAIVEGLAYRIKNENVPNALKGYTIFKLNTASLTGFVSGTNQLRIQSVVEDLQIFKKIILFIDEIHTLIGTGEETLDFANIFKPLIDRGDVKLIGATTTDEYNRYILRDKAFVRRFQKIDVTEPDREMVIKIMMGTYPKFENKMGLKLKYSEFIKQSIMAFIVDLTSEFKRVYEISARYPDISLTILQQAFSYASFDNREYVDIRDIKKAIATTKLVYPKVIKNELERFNIVFKDVYIMETKQTLKDED